MARWIITTKRKKFCNGVAIEPGMTIEVVNTGINPVTCDKRKEAATAFRGGYGIDAVKANILNMADLDVKFFR